MNIVRINTKKDFFSEITKEKLTTFLFDNLKPYEDPLEIIGDGIDRALSQKNSFILIAVSDGILVGVVVVLDTGMRGYIPENLLLFIAVQSNMRGRGIGRKLVEMTISECDGSIKLHVEYDNPAKKLYEKIGFSSKYAEMRYMK